MKKLIIIILLFLLFVFGASVWPVGFHSTLTGMRAAAADKPGTFIYAGQGLYLLSWPHQGGYAFAVINQRGDLVDDLARMVNGTGTSIYKMSDLIKWMESQGWQRISGAQLPVSIGQVLLGQVMWSVIQGSQALTTVVILPAGLLIPTPEVLQ